ncbi:hypothetical protein HDU76_006381 [Blyttiomyces sp. JEL0837]|nr:hypothetical protein HDU76_006381 [Blyttiomyces sp. JEL0837]
MTSEPQSQPHTKQQKRHSSRRSFWDLLPIEIKSNIISKCDPVTRYLNNDLTNPEEIKLHGNQMWKIVFEQDLVDFNLNILPQSQFPNIKNGLDLVQSEQMYQNLCNLRPDLTNTDELKRYLQNDAMWNWRKDLINLVYGSRPNRPTDYCNLSTISSLLIHIPLRYLCWNYIPDWLLQMDPSRVFTVASCFGHIDLAKYLTDRVAKEDINNFVKDIGSDCLTEASRNGYIDIVKLLISFKSSYINRSAYWALELACEYAHINIVNFFVNLFDSGELADGLHQIFIESCWKKNEVAVGMLSKHFGDKMKSGWLYDGLLSATERGNTGIVRVLLSTSEHLLRSGVCEAVLFEVVDRGRDIKIDGVRLLVGFCGITPMKESAVRKGYTRVAEFLRRLETGTLRIRSGKTRIPHDQEEESEEGSDDWNDDDEDDDDW